MFSPVRVMYILQCGGTIDKDYPRKSRGYAFEICEPAAKRILSKAFLDFQDGTPESPTSSNLAPFVIEEILREDSLDITDAHRDKIVMRIMDLCSRSPSDAADTRILITHGTDTMIETGRYIAERTLRMPSPPVIVLTGALLPERFKDTDADFNVGMAIGALQCLTRPGVYIACTGQVIPVEHAERIIATGKFFNLLSSEAKP